MVKLTGGRSEIEKIIQILEDTPQRIADCTANSSQERLRQAPAEDEWSPAEVLAHLRSCQEVWTYSIYAMLALNQPTLASVHPRAWAQAKGYERFEFQHSLRVFSLRRQELLGTLNELTQEEWGRSAVIDGRVHSVFSQARRMALHEPDHCDQIESLLASLE